MNTNDKEQRDRFAEIAFAELCKVGVKDIFEMRKKESMDKVIIEIGRASYKFADSAMDARNAAERAYVAAKQSEEKETP